VAQDARQRPTLNDVARVAGVHAGTASRALNGDPQGGVNPATAERVRAAAEQLGYRPNQVARGLKMNRSFSIGVIVPDLTNPIIPPVVRGIEQRLGPAGYTVLLGNTDHEPEREATFVDAMVARQVDGLIMATARSVDQPLAERSALLPIVLVNRTATSVDLPAAVPDNHGCVELAVGHLAGLGHRTIAHAGGPSGTSSGTERLEAFRRTCAARGIVVDDALVASAERYTIDEGRRVGRALLAGEAPISAIVAANDMLALGCIDAIRERGLRCPQDVSVVGINDMPFADRFDPPLTTVRIPHYELGVTAAELLLERFAQPQADSRLVQLSPELVVRASSGPAPGR
jgi:LacI family transcriptional regulator